jgi:nucleotide-binding universal stress UspA family protein
MGTKSWMQGRSKSILLATDLSPRCDRAFDRAMFLAAEWQARLIAVHVMETGGTGAMAGTDPVPWWRRPANPQRLAESRIRAEMREVSPDLAVVIERGDPVEAILRAAEAYSCGLIVTGVARFELLGRLVLGSTVNRLVQRSHVPVLVVRKRGHRPYRHVVVATDFSDSSRHALEAAVRLFPQQALTVFNAYDAPMSGLMTDAPSYREQFREAAAREGEAFVRSSDLSGLLGRKPEIMVEYGEPDRCSTTTRRRRTLIWWRSALTGGARSLMFSWAAWRRALSPPYRATL